MRLVHAPRAAAHKLAEVFSSGQGFADAYNRGRPSYSLQAATRLLELSGLEPGCQIVELGAGSGRFTTVLAQAMQALAVQPAAMLVTEPSAMLDEASPLPSYAQRARADAASIPVVAGAADAVVAAQCFHWFARWEEMAEIHRVLAPGAPLCLYWHIRKPGSPSLQQLEDLVTDAYPTDAPRAQTREWLSDLQECGLFVQEAHEEVAASWGGDLATCAAGIMSISGVAARGPEDKVEIKREVSRLLRRAAQETGQDAVGQLRFPATEELWVFRS